MTLELQKDRLNINEVCKTEFTKPHMYVPATNRTQSLLDIMALYSNGLQIALKRSYAITARRQHSLVTKKQTKNSCAAHSIKGMVVISSTKVNSNLGAMTVEYPISIMDIWLRKKYIGV